MNQAKEVLATTSLEYRTALFSAKTQDWRTPDYLYKILDDEFHFDFDPCPANPEGIRQFDGLGEWGARNYVNPPYKWPEIIQWMKKAVEQRNKGKIIVMLLPVRTGPKWFHEYVLGQASEVRFIRGRIRFGIEPRRVSPFDSMVIVYQPNERATRVISFDIGGKA